MIAVIQRVERAEVSVDGKTTGKCGKGLLIFLGVKNGDTQHDAEILVSKISKLRIFDDDNGKLNFSLIDIGGSALVISNFTLCANYNKSGNRPDYFNAAPPDIANPLYEYFAEILGKIVKTESGIFGADMKVSAVNDGPVTLIIDSDILLKKV
jgi:D-tyrosyl-tRNA(Tyr) deacylase